MIMMTTWTIRAPCSSLFYHYTPNPQKGTRHGDDDDQDENKDTHELWCKLWSFTLQLNDGYHAKFIHS